MMKKKLLTGFLAVVLAISGMVVMPKNVEAADLGVDYDTTGEYNISNYWSIDNKKVPVKDGYVFAGWYEPQGDEKYVPLKEEDLKTATLSEITAVAKFVPADVLSVKTQMAEADVPELGGTRAFLRLLSTTDSSHYQKVGFEYQLGTKSTAELKTKEMTTIYSAIKPSQNSNDVLNPGTTFVEGVSKYFIALDVTNISQSSYASIVYARAFWVTKDGTKVMGLARNNRVEDKIVDNLSDKKEYISAGITLLSDGHEPAEVAVGKVVVKYNTIEYDVVPDNDTYKIDTGKVLSVMRYHVDEENGRITFVANTDTVNTNKLADGLFANVRFVNVSDNKDAKLDFEVQTGFTAFCNWDEDSVDTVSVQ